VGRPPRVSVVIIYLNPGDFLDEAIASVEAQTHEDWELLLVDDGSSDQGPAVARRHAERRPDRIRCLEHPGHANLGMSASRNLGAAHATGEYVTFLDADDVLVPSALTILAELLDAEPRAAMVYGPIEYWYSWAGAAARRRDFVQRLGVPVDTVLRPPALLLRFLRRRAAAPSGMVIRAGVLSEIGGFEGVFRGMYEDQALCAKLCLQHGVLVTDRCVYRYRQHPRSSSAAADASGVHDAGRRPFLEWFEGYLRTRGMTRGPVWSALRRELWWSAHPVLHKLARRATRTWRRLRR
jgi:glycosyltransferase involved in cell wall biosynthesis